MSSLVAPFLLFLLDMLLSRLCYFWFLAMQHGPLSPQATVVSWLDETLWLKRKMFILLLPHLIFCYLVLFREWEPTRWLVCLTAAISSLSPGLCLCWRLPRRSAGLQAVVLGGWRRPFFQPALVAHRRGKRVMLLSGDDPTLELHTSLWQSADTRGELLEIPVCSNASSRAAVLHHVWKFIACSTIYLFKRSALVF